MDGKLTDNNANENMKVEKRKPDYIMGGSPETYEKISKERENKNGGSGKQESAPLAAISKKYQRRLQ